MQNQGATNATDWVSQPHEKHIEGSSTKNNPEVDIGLLVTNLCEKHSHANFIDFG